MNDLISRQAESEQPERKEEFMKLTVRDSNGRPYYSIIYLEFDENGVGYEFEGYSSYSLDVISDYLKKFFMLSAEPKHGKWTEINIKDYKALCSECGTWSPVMGKFCPECGARMDGE